MEFKRIEAEIKRLNWMGEVGSLDDEDIEWLKELEDLFALRIVGSSKPEKQEQLLDSEKKCKGDTIKGYYAIEKDIIDNLDQSIEDKTLS